VVLRCTTPRVTSEGFTPQFSDGKKRHFVAGIFLAEAEGMKVQRTASVLIVATVCACLDGTQRSSTESFVQDCALFRIDFRNAEDFADLSMTIDDTEEGARYAAFVSPREPRFAGWVAFEPFDEVACAGVLDNSCLTSQGLGYFAGSVRATGLQAQLRSGVLRTAESRDREESSRWGTPESSNYWTLYVALLRVEQSARMESVSLAVAGLEGDNVGCQFAGGPTPSITRIR